MTTLQKCPMIVIDPDEDRVEEVKKMLGRSMERVAVINTKCLPLRLQEINELIGDGNYLKIFYGCSEVFFKETIENLSLKSGELKYIGWKLDISKIVICFWDHCWKKKGFEVFPPTVSTREESYGQEL
ncbi:MAG: hypothetical protein UW04_C0032G0007 [Parcubacteria group bacterium GW2011_GWB1_43_8]|nr:MAG: hypothetical protein UW04_C0032G0007 [Parcubacteria group bacterium GW2011_GWB1_43_8]